MQRLGRLWCDGVNPSGGPVEGFSAPLSFFMYAACYLCLPFLTTYLKMQTWLSTFLLGGLCSLMAGGNLFNWLGAFLFSRCGSFFMWHASEWEPYRTCFHGFDGVGDSSCTRGIVGVCFGFFSCNDCTCWGFYWFYLYFFTSYFSIENR